METGVSNMIYYEEAENGPEFLFNNFISKPEDHYFCFLCAKKLPFLFLVECHSKDIAHQKLRRDKIDDRIFHNIWLSNPIYKLAIQHSIFMKTQIFHEGKSKPKPAQPLFCYLCNCDVKILKMETHIETADHKRQLSILISCLKLLQIEWSSLTEIFYQYRNSNEYLNKVDFRFYDDNELTVTEATFNIVMNDGELPRGGMINWTAEQIAILTQGIIHIYKEDYTCIICEVNLSQPKLTKLDSINNHVNEWQHRQQILRLREEQCSLVHFDLTDKIRNAKMEEDSSNRERRCKGRSKCRQSDQVHFDLKDIIRNREMNLTDIMRNRGMEINSSNKGHSERRQCDQVRQVQADNSDDDKRHVLILLIKMGLLAILTLVRWCMFLCVIFIEGIILIIYIIIIGFFEVYKLVIIRRLVFSFISLLLLRVFWHYLRANTLDFIDTLCYKAYKSIFDGAYSLENSIRILSEFYWKLYLVFADYISELHRFSVRFFRKYKYLIENIR